MKALAAPLCLALLAACARTEDADASAEPTNEPYNVAEPVRTASAEDEVALGSWRRSLQEDQAALEFGPQGTAPVLSIVCGERGGIVLQRHGALASGSSPAISISINAQGRQLPATAAGGATPMLRANIAAGDALLAQLAEASGPITIRTGDGPPLVLPPNELIGEYAASCAGGTAASRAATAPNAANAANAAAPAEAASNEATDTAAPAR